MTMYPWQKNAFDAFSNYLETGRIPDALLIWGPSGCGKLELAKTMARRLMCQTMQGGQCDPCRSCALFESGAHPDFREITFEVNQKTGKLRDLIIVDQIRGLIEALVKTTTISQTKVAIIHPAERMNPNAANALLKTLEEPVGQTVQILVSHDPGRLPATVRSRCQRLHVDAPKTDLAQQWLEQSVDVEGEAATLALKASSGRPLEAKALIEDGGLDQYRDTLQVLQDLRAGNISDSHALMKLADLDSVRLWNWLSLRCADAMRTLTIKSGPESLIRGIADLQHLADRNRRLMATPVRKDLLLRDWLIQWASI